MAASMCWACRSKTTCNPLDAIALLLAAGITWGIWAALRGGFILPGARGLQITGFDVNAGGLGALAVAVAIYYYGWIFGIALILAVITHEYGHVVAYRVCGHSDARFRLIPLMGGVAISNRLPATQGNAFFIALMGPAICLAPMSLAFALSTYAFDAAPLVGAFLFAYGMVLASFNFFNLLPFWPLDGGRMVQILAQTYIPWATRQVSIAMTLIGAALALFTQSWFILFFILISWGGLMQSEQILGLQRPMTKGRAFLALAAYGFTAAAFFKGGSFLLQGLL
jgi:Zn-dependent protease